MTDAEFTAACDRYVAAWQANYRLRRIVGWPTLAGFLALAAALWIAFDEDAASYAFLPLAATLCACSLGGFACVWRAGRESHRILAAVNEHDARTAISRIAEYSAAREAAHRR